MNLVTFNPKVTSPAECHRSVSGTLKNVLVHRQMTPITTSPSGLTINQTLIVMSYEKMQSYQTGNMLGQLRLQEFENGAPIWRFLETVWKAKTHKQSTVGTLNLASSEIVVFWDQKKPGLQNDVK